MGQEQEDFYRELESFERRFASQRPELELTVRDNELGVQGFVVVWNSSPGKRGPLGPMGKGGTRITPTVNLEEIKMLSQRMALKNAAAGLAMGGAKSGMCDDPDSPGFEARYRRFVQLVAPNLVERGGIFGGFGFDIGARPEHPLWACNELGTNRCFTGKPLAMGGTDYDREGIAGLGVAVAAATAVEVRDESRDSIRCAIQGMGAMGAAAFRYLRELGLPIAAISDPRLGAAFRLPESLSPELEQALQEQNFSAAKLLLNTEALELLPIDEILFLDVEMILPCAVQGVLTTHNQGKVKARYVIEGANGPADRETQSAFEQREIFVVPDFIANPGGIIAAYVELSSLVSVEENLKTRAKVEEAKRVTKERIAANVCAVSEIASRCGVGFVDAGRLLAFKNMYL